MMTTRSKMLESKEYKLFKKQSGITKLPKKVPNIQNAFRNDYVKIFH